MLLTKKNDWNIVKFIFCDVIGYPINFKLLKGSIKIS